MDKTMMWSKDHELLCEVFDAAFNAMAGAKGHIDNTSIDCVTELETIVETARQGALRAQREMIAAARDGELVKKRE